MLKQDEKVTNLATDTTLETIRELTDCRIFGTLTGATYERDEHTATGATGTILSTRDQEAPGT
jgi:hypothetical protein